jgi:DNA-binding MarR family transcriptional regulator
MQRLSKQSNDSPRPVGLLIGAARRSIQQAVARHLRRRRLSSQQFWLLVALHEQPGPALHELAGRRLMDPPTASRMVDVLVRRGLVRLEADPGDRRRRSISLTARGAALVQALHPLALQVREAIEVGFSAAEAEALRGMLLRVVANMERFAQASDARAEKPGRRRTT